MRLAFRLPGSHAAMTCHIVVMRHRISGVVSLGHFDNFCCWQFGEDSSAHRDGLEIMVKEIAALSSDDADNIEVTVVGGYTDVRGDAARNSLSLLKSLHDHWVSSAIIHHDCKLMMKMIKILAILPLSNQIVHGSWNFS